MKFKEYLKESTLKKLMKSGSIVLKNGEYIGKAADGEEVSLGSKGEEKTIEKYLKDHPTPKDW